LKVGSAVSREFGIEIGEVSRRRRLFLFLGGRGFRLLGGWGLGLGGSFLNSLLDLSFSLNSRSLLLGRRLSLGHTSWLASLSSRGTSLGSALCSSVCLSLWLGGALLGSRCRLNGREDAGLAVAGRGACFTSHFVM